VSDSVFRPGDRVVTPEGPGTVIDTSGEFAHLYARFSVWVRVDKLAGQVFSCFGFDEQNVCAETEAYMGRHRA